MLKYGFHFTYNGSSPRTEIVTIRAESLEEARLAYNKQRDSNEAIEPRTCTRITMPQDYERFIDEPRRQLKKKLWWTYTRGLIVVVLLGLLITLLTSCSLRECNTSLKRFNKKLTNWTNERYGIQTYHLKAIEGDEPYRLPPSRPDEN